MSESIKQHLIAITIFPNFAAKTRETWDMTLPEIGDMILAENRKGGEAGKGRLPWLKLAEFGDMVNPKTKSRSLRHDANVKWITGVEIDHDSGRPIAEAIAQLAAAGIRALVYTSPSYLLLPDKSDGSIKEKWRVLAPTSGPLDPGLRAGLTARLNGVLKGAATAESFVLSQSYYFGSVDRNPAHAVEILDGDFIDLRSDLDAGAIGSPGQASRKKRKKTAPGPEAAPGWSEDDIDRLIATACDVNDRGENQWHENMRSVTASMVNRLKTDLEIHEKCEPGYGDERGYDDVQKLIDTARAKYGVPNPEDDVEFAELLGSVREDAKAAGMDVPAEEPQVRTARAKPAIYYGDLDDMVDQAARILIGGAVEFYQRGGKLVRPVVMDVVSFGGAPTFTAQVVEVDMHYMRDTMSRRMQFLKWNQAAKQWINIHPPVPVALTLLSKFGDWDFRPLAGLITTQTMRPDGSLLTEAGYDEATQLLLIKPPQMVDIPEQPTRADAEAALALLKDLLSEFPFTIEDESGLSLSRAVALSAQISTVCRGAYPVMPMHCVDAPAAGTGKSYLLSTVAWIATGEAMPAMNAGKTPEETGKRLAAAALTGQVLICIDNVEGELGGDTLCQIIEQTKLKFRPLGVSDIVEIDTRSMCIFADGNNMILVGDVYRRALTCRLNAQVDRPEKRQFKRDPKREILADRGRYVAACLTIARAYLAAGRPSRCPQLGSFNEWSDCVRSALVWLGEADCVDTMDSALGEDPGVIAHQVLLEEWHSVFGDRRVLLKDVVAKCNERVAGSELSGSMQYVYGELRQAVMATNPEAHRRDIDTNFFGQRMKQFRDKWVSGLCFVNRRSNGETLWNVRIGASRPVLRTKSTKTKTEKTE